MKIETKIFILLSATALTAFAIGKYDAFASIWSGVGVIVLTTVASHLFSRSITRPLQELTQWSDEISQHNYSQSTALTGATTPAILALQRQDEIGGLARAFRQMETELERSLEDLKQTTAVKERMESELQIGRDIQMNMLTLGSASFPKHKDLEIYAFLQPAREVGGDFYDFYFRRENLSYLFEENRFCFCVGDASGKGVPAALFMAVIKTLIKSQAYIDLSPANILTHVNEVISADNPSCMFVTLFFGVLNLTDGELVYTNAGHNPPYLRRRDGSIEHLNQRHGPALGVIEGITYKENKLILQTGDILVTYTDGVTEAMNPTYDLFSEERFLDLVQSDRYSSAEEIITLTVEAVNQFQGVAEQADDLTMLSLQYLRQSTSTADPLEIAINNEALSSLREQWK